MACMVAATLSAASAQQRLPGDALEPGAGDVGFATYDGTRPGDPARRRFQIACWYPAVSVSGIRKSMTVEEYLALGASDDPAAGRRNAVADYRQLLVDNGVDGSLVSKWLGTPARAIRDAPRARGRAPLVLIAQGNDQSVYDQALLSELLASDGYVVCTAPSPVRLQGPMTSEDDVLRYATAQAALLEETARVARRVLRADEQSPATVGHSFGARAALLYAERHGARALVSLDGGIGFAQGRDWLQGSQRERLVTRFTTPVLHIYETDERAAAPDFTLLEALSHSERLLAHVDGLRHIDFTSAGFASRAVPGIFGESPAALDAKLSAIAAYTRAFLAAHLKEDASARALLDAPAPRWLTTRRLPAQARQ
jgi:dienelactone hydrolase